MENPFEIIIERLEQIEKKLSELSAKVEKPTIVSQEREIMSLNSVDEFLELSKSAVYKLTSTRGIAHFKQGKRLYFRKIEIDNWASENRIKTMKEIELEAAEYIRKHPRKY
jgi:predicted DNA-binding transcriptional regulator AlpA